MFDLLIDIQTHSNPPEPEAEAEDKDPETMTAEEFREELRRMRVSGRLPKPSVCD
jgi:hypothetical protein